MGLVTGLVTGAVVLGFLGGLLGGLYAAWVGLRWSQQVAARQAPSQPAPAAVARDAGIAPPPKEDPVQSAMHRQLQSWLVGDGAARED